MDDGDDGDRRNPPPMPSTYVTLVQLEQRWLQEKQRKQREKEEQERQQKIEIEKEERKREEQQRQQDEEANPQKTQVESTTALPSRNRRPPLRTNRSIQSEKSQFRAIVVSDGEERKREEQQRQQDEEANLQKTQVESTTALPSRNRRPPLRTNRSIQSEKSQFRAIVVSDGEERKREEQLRQQDEEANLQKTQVESTTALPSRNRRPPLRTNRSIQSEKSQCRAIVVSDGESKTGDLKKEEKKNKQRYYRWKAKWKSRAEETLISGREHLSVEKEDLSEQNSVVSAERDYEKEIGGKCEGVSSSGGKRGDGKYSRGVKNWGKPRVEEDLSNGKEQLSVGKEDLISEENAVVSTERECEKEIGGKSEGFSSSGGKRGNGKYSSGVKTWGKPRVEEELSNGKEQLSVGKEDLISEENAVVSTERECEKKIGEKCGGVSSSGGKRGNGKHSRGVKNGGKPRVEEDLSNGKEKLVKNEVEAENIAVVSTEKHGKFMGNGKDLVVNNGRVWEKKARGVDGEVLVGVLRKVEGLSVRSGRGGNGKYGGIENGSPRRYRWSSGRVNSQRVEMPRASNLVWVRKEEGEASDANVAGD